MTPETLDMALRRLGHHVPGHFQRRDADPGAGLTLHGQSGEISGTFINQGTINADLAGRTAGSTADEDLTLIGTGWINQGTLQVDNGATLNTAGTWSNTGTINVKPVPRSTWAARSRRPAWASSRRPRRARSAAPAAR